MKINSGTIGMESARSYRASTKTVRQFQITDYQESLEQNKSNITNLAETQGRLRMSAGRVKIRSSVDNTISDIRQITIRYIFDMLFAERRDRLKSMLEEYAPEKLNYVLENHHVETEETSFSTQGTVRTSDGREISFQVNVSMSRRFEAYYKEELNYASFSLCDPLVINMDTDVAELSDQTFYFDIDADGEKDEISQLGRGSGYLALDKNGDGVINDGKELFGATNGDGFAALAEYDEDGNGWIDENDAIWSKLKIWTKDENGKDLLYTLADKGVGALCLQNAATDFALKSAIGQMQGIIRKTGIFLYENGNVGTLQHVDVAKYYREA